MCWADGEVIVRTTRVYEKKMSSLAAAVKATSETWCSAVIGSQHGGGQE